MQSTPNTYGQVPNRPLKTLTQLCCILPLLPPRPLHVKLPPPWGKQTPCSICENYLRRRASILFVAPFFPRAVRLRNTRVGGSFLVCLYAKSRREMHVTRFAASNSNKAISTVVNETPTTSLIDAAVLYPNSTAFSISA